MRGPASHGSPPGIRASAGAEQVSAGGGPDVFLRRLVPAAALAAAVEIGDRRGARLRSAAGVTRRRGGEPVGDHTPFDLASLTKPFTATLALALDAQGTLPLAARIGEIVPAVHRRAARCPLESLLRHRSGLLAWAPLEALGRPQDALAQLLEPGLWRAPGPIYSDLGYILWGLLAERVTGASLDDLLRAHVLAPLGIERAGNAAARATSPLPRAREAKLARPLGLALRRSTAAPRPCLPQDGNARFLGGLAGHAGLFANAAAVAALAVEWLVPRRVLTVAARDRALAGPAGDYALGWARRRVRGSAGRALSRRAFGHAGFTGGSVWIDPVGGFYAVLLAHRRTLAVDMTPWRHELHRLAAALSARRAAARLPPSPALSS